MSQNRVSIIFLLVLGSANQTTNSYSMILTVSIVFLLVLGSVKVAMRNNKNRTESQSYSCWYWVLSIGCFTSYLDGGLSQSYSCWYWVLSLLNSLEFMEKWSQSYSCCDWGLWDKKIIV